MVCSESSGYEGRHDREDYSSDTTSDPIDRSHVWPIEMNNILCEMHALCYAESRPRLWHHASSISMFNLIHMGLLSKPGGVDNWF
jgi:hypothetical protein